MFARHLSILVTAILLSAATASQARDFPQPFGASADAASAQREVTIGPMTKYVHVERAETVRFVTQQGIFTWNFDTAPNRSVVDLAQIAPAGFKADGVRIFVDEPTGGR